MKTITREEAQTLLTEIGHQAHVRVPVALKVDEQYTNQETSENVTEEWRTVLNNCMVYNPFGKQQYGMSNNATNAKNTMRFVKDRFTVSTNYFGFQYANGDYEIVD